MPRTTRVISTRVAIEEAEAIEQAATRDGRAATRNDWTRRVLAEAAAEVLDADGDDEDTED